MDNYYRSSASNCYLGMSHDGRFLACLHGLASRNALSSQSRFGYLYDIVRIGCLDRDLDLGRRSGDCCCYYCGADGCYIDCVVVVVVVVADVDAEFVLVAGIPVGCNGVYVVAKRNSGCPPGS